MRPLAVPALLAIAAAMPGLESFIVGPRALGMGGANAASTEQTPAAQYYNPGVFGFFAHGNEQDERVAADNQNLWRKDFGFGIDATLGYRVHKDFDRYVDQIIAADYKKLSSSAITSQSDVQKAILLAEALGNIAKDGNAISADYNAGSGLRIGSFGIGARVFSQVTGFVRDVDATNLGFNANGAALATQIDNAVSGSNTSLDVLSASQAQTLYASLGGVGAFGTTPGATNAVYDIDDQAVRAGVTREQAAGTVSILSTAASSASGSLQNNTTKVILTGYALAEVPITYGHAINDHVSIGASLKGMIARVYGTQVLVFQDDALAQLEQADQNYEQSFQVGVDIGLAVRFDSFQLGLTGRNLNSPSFAGPTIAGRQFDELRMKPQVTAGVAWIPHETFTIEVDADLVPGETTLASYDSQHVGAGLEWDVFGFLALRAGAYRNIAADDAPTMATAGVGLNLWLLRIDTAGAFSYDDEVTIDGQTLPRESRASLAITFDY